MNDESLKRANAFLAAVAERIEPGGQIEATPADIGNQIGLPDPLAAARAVRALLARRRLESVDGKYRLVDARPLEPGEPEAIPRAPRRRKAQPAARTRAPRAERTSYSEIGRAAIDRLLEVSRELGQVRGNLRTAREEARESREALDEAQRRSSTLGTRVRELEAKLEMAEANLRTLLAAAKGTPRSDSVGDAEMDAILSVLKRNQEG